MLHVLRGLLVVVAALLLLSMGGAIFTAPILVPLLYLAARTSNDGAYQAMAGTVTALTMAEVVWAATYVTIGEAKPWIWLLPVIGMLATGVGFIHTAKSQAAKVSPA